MTRSKKQNKLNILITSLGWRGLSALVLALSLLWWLFIYSPYPKTPIQIPFDIGRKGAVVETDFTIPYTFETGYGYYEISVAFEDKIPERFQEDIENMFDEKTGERIYTTMERIVGVSNPRAYGTKDPKVYFKGADILLKLTLTPHNNIKSPIVYILGSDGARYRRLELESPQEALTLVAKFDEYGPFASIHPTATVKPIIHLDPQLGGRYRLRVESLKEVSLPEGIETNLVVLEGIKPK